jgi:hypothetical protein
MMPCFGDQIITSVAAKTRTAPPVRSRWNISATPDSKSLTLFISEPIEGFNSRAASGQNWILHD